MSDELTYCYVGRMPVCGCIGVVTVDMPEHAKDTAKCVAEMVRDGLNVERMLVDDFRKTPAFGCAHKLKMKECKKRGLNVTKPEATLL